MIKSIEDSNIDDDLKLLSLLLKITNNPVNKV